MNKIPLLLLFTVVIQYLGIGQMSHSFLKNVHTRASLQLETSKFDSVVFLNDYSVWHDDLTTNGFAFKMKKVYA